MREVGGKGDAERMTASLYSIEYMYCFGENEESVLKTIHHKLCTVLHFVCLHVALCCSRCFFLLVHCFWFISLLILKDCYR